MALIKELKTENLRRPLGIDAKSPRLSWKIESMRRNVMQKSYRILAYADEEETDQLWDSGTVQSDQSVNVRWGGPMLSSCQRVYWKVVAELADGDGVTEQAESRLTWFEMGLLQESDWHAHWIEPEDDIDPDKSQPAPLLRRDFIVRPGLKNARIYQTAHGLYEFWINGKAGCQDKFKPGFTSYYERLQYQVYDITDLLREGENLLMVLLGDGWWRGTTGGAFRNNFGTKLAYLGQLHLLYEDGSEEWIGSDERFETTTGPLLYNDMKYGELWDARKKAEAWRPVHLETDDFATYHNLIASRSVPVREKETFQPKVLHTPNGETVLDFGQNIAGYVRMCLYNLTPGQTITLHHGEALDENGNFTLKNLVIDASAEKMQTVTYIAGEEAEAVYAPTFAVFGFRYVQVSGIEEVRPKDFTAIAVYSDLEESGDFTCSNALINKLVSNSRWSQKGNFLDVPTDCPTRERSPWTGDSQIYAKTSTEFMNVYPFFEKWLADFTVEQNDNGSVPITIPLTAAVHDPALREKMLNRIDSLPDDHVMKLVMKMTLGPKETGALADNAAGWGDAAVILPYTMYLCYGDRAILEKQYPCAKKWVDYERRQAAWKNDRYRDKPWYDAEDGRYIWDSGFHFGEWCEPGTPDDSGSIYRQFLDNPDYTTATMYFYHSASLLAEMADILDIKDDAAFYRLIAEEIRKAFNKYLITEEGEIIEEPGAVTVQPVAGRQAPYVRALAFGLAEGIKKEKVLKKLTNRIVANDYKLNTGFLATAHLLPVLAENGYTDLAYRLLEQEAAPGWLYNVKCGATTILENWDGFEKCQASFNHYSYGAVCDFLFSYVAGIRPEIQEPGYRHFVLQPMPGGMMTHAAACLDTVYGKVSSSWKREGERIFYEFTVPANTTASVILKGEEPFRIGSGQWSFSGLGSSCGFLI